MDAFIDSIVQLPHRVGTSGIIHLGIAGRKHRAFQFRTGAGGIGETRPSPVACLLSATLGNTAGGMTCYYMGRLGKISWIEKYFKVKKEKVDKMVNFLQGKGALMAFFAFLPAIGEVIAIALGFMRSNTWTYRRLHVCRQVSTLYPSSVCARKRLGCSSRIKFFQVIGIKY